jgi:hypothetical protein
MARRKKLTTQLEDLDYADLTRCVQKSGPGDEHAENDRNVAYKKILSSRKDKNAKTKKTNNNMAD